MRCIDEDCEDLVAKTNMVQEESRENARKQREDLKKRTALQNDSNANCIKEVAVLMKMNQTLRDTIKSLENAANSSPITDTVPSQTILET